MQDKRINIALAIAVIVHAGGLWGMTCYNQDLFASATPLNLVLCCLLMLYTAQDRNRNLFIFLVISFLVGFLVECIGVNTGLLFGKYTYLPAMGPQLLGVPLVLGINWATTMYCCGIAINHLMQKFVSNTNTQAAAIYKKWALPIDAAILATVFDWVLEPAAIKLKFWQWHTNTGMPPLFNYVCWFGTSLLLMFLFNKLNFDKRNTFAIHLLLIQMLFFVLINTLI
jgi:bisanhydrobacterioruberin hydratase